MTGSSTSPPLELRTRVEQYAAQSPRRIVEVTDYLLVTTYDFGGATPAGHRGAFRLPREIRIERLPTDLAERLMRAAEPKGEDWEPTRQFNCVHAYVRTVWTEGEEVSDAIDYWDQERCLYPCAQLSRLIRDNNTSTEYAVQRRRRADSSEALVPFSGFDSHVAYRLYPEERGWLDVGEAGELARLLTAFWDEAQRPPRVGRALRRSDSVTRERYLEDALPIVVGGLEALLKVGRPYATAQFEQRVPRLAAELGVDNLDEAICRELYDDRSALVHGSEVDLSQPHTLDAFAQGFVALQETLRRAVRRAIEEPSFAAHFVDDERIKGAWPAVVVNRAGEREAI